MKLKATTTLLGEDALKNPNNDLKWKRSECDKLLDEYLAGANPKEIAVRLKRNPKSIRRRLEQYTYNERDRAIRYRPRRRISRIGRRMSENDKLIIHEHQKRGVPTEVTAKLLARRPAEILRDYEGESKVARITEIAPSVDVLMAHRYLYWCAKKPIISNLAYDQSKAETIEFGPSSALLEPASDKPIDYPPHIRALANYLLFKHWTEKDPEDNDYERKLPVEFSKFKKSK